MAHFDSLTLFFPMWNEELQIHRAVEAGIEMGENLVDIGEIERFELVIVDDASTDETGAIADKLAANDQRIHVVHHEVNRKLGGSIKTGLAASTGDVVVYTDADLPFDLEETAKALRLLRVYEADIVSAYRFDRTGEGPLRYTYSFFYNALVRYLFKLRVRDVNFACKVIRREVLDHVELESEGSFIDVELLLRAQRLGFSLIQFGVDYFPRSRGNSTLSSPTVILKILNEMIRLRSELESVQPIRGGNG